MSKSAGNSTTTKPENRVVKQRARFTKADKETRTVLIPNLSSEFGKVLEMSISYRGYKTKNVPMANQEAIELGKRHIHNDICFPAQIQIGEMLYEMKNGGYTSDNAAFALSKNCNSCRALQYYALARKALDDTGHADIPVVTSGEDLLDIQPGFNLGLPFRIKTLHGMIFIDALNFMRERILPYELNPGETEKVHAHYLELGMVELKKSFIKGMKVLKDAVEEFNAISIDRSTRKPIVGIVGEILVNYHTTSNYNLVKYLYQNGMEVYLPPILEFFRQDIVNLRDGVRRKLSRHPLLDLTHAFFLELLYKYHLGYGEKVMSKFKFYEKREKIETIAHYAEDIIDRSFYTGEGWLLPGEIISMIKKGAKSILIIQPFGCLPNHISGRGVIKSVKEKHPDVQILSLDYDPDVSLGNIENRLQMLIITAREMARRNQAN